MPAVNIYITTGLKGPKEQDGAAVYVLETATSRGIYAREYFMPVHGMTANRAELMAAIEAIGRMKEPCELHIYMESPYVAAGCSGKWYERWQQNGWKNAKGKEIAYREEWEELSRLLQLHDCTFSTGRHAYSDWMEWNIKRGINNKGGK